MDDKLFTFAGLISTDHSFITIFYTLLSAVITIGISMFAVRKLQAVPKGIQNFYEWIISGMLYVGKDTLGDKLARKYFPLAGSIGVFVFYCNVIGIVPGFESPTSSISFTLVLALIVFFYYHFEGIRANGVIKYFGHFAGPVKLLSPLLFPIEIISHLSRIISLSFRLFGNIKGDDMFLLVMLTLVPWIVPLLPFAILMFMAVLQAFVFMILTYVYLASAVLIEDDH
ncbi:F0F1 ATP synthase subunit A [Helicobacter muridarum]|uniref:ATP synthase subunit a n=1 Tax=Helicobacter muridarum TaxID=216 RepID=A0A099U1E0_9HELI|nr:F0F1 ATP synthase subunit A [Helicobacter muridarum]TLE00345.1 F0F1 ATP synthase subunit A [Helicobacter muridarum]STQ85849.1 ATP synthase F0 subunit A [Helicobacter muridarum]